MSCAALMEDGYSYLPRHIAVFHVQHKADPGTCVSRWRGSEKAECYDKTGDGDFTIVLDYGRGVKDRHHVLIRPPEIFEGLPQAWQMHCMNLNLFTPPVNFQWAGVILTPEHHLAVRDWALSAAACDFSTCRTQKI